MFLFQLRRGAGGTVPGGGPQAAPSAPEEPQLSAPPLCTRRTLRPAGRNAPAHRSKSTMPTRHLRAPSPPPGGENPRKNSLGPCTPLLRSRPNFFLPREREEKNPFLQGNLESVGAVLLPGRVPERGRLVRLTVARAFLPPLLSTPLRNCPEAEGLFSPLGDRGSRSALGLGALQVPLGQSRGRPQPPATRDRPWSVRASAAVRLPYGAFGGKEEVRRIGRSARSFRAPGGRRCPGGGEKGDSEEDSALSSSSELKTVPGSIQGILPGCKREEGETSVLFQNESGLNKQRRAWELEDRLSGT
ncbi:uncharacterized protein [Dasypus novemcinctus]|uniref:uncharacterized protein n=1 Tax=Dasypus novemcinctus TaxID=9361 RepID=UPI0039C8CDB5